MESEKLQCTFKNKNMVQQKCAGTHEDAAYIIVGGDFRPPLNQQAFNKRVIYAWDEIDFGMPSVYQARILTPHPTYL